MWLAAAVGALVGVINIFLWKFIMRKVLLRQRLGLAMGIFLGKLAILAGVFYLLVVSLRLEPLGLLVGFAVAMVGQVIFLVRGYREKV